MNDINIDGILRQNFYLYEGQYELLREYAHQQRMSMSEVVRRLIDTLDLYNPSIKKEEQII